MSTPTVDRLEATRTAIHDARRDLTEAHDRYMKALRLYSIAKKRHRAELADAHRRAGL